MAVVLPALPFLTTPNESPRLAGVRPHLVVVHAWGNEPATTPAEAVARFKGNVAFMCNATSQVSAHVVYGGQLIPRGQPRAAQLVRWERKAWTQAGANSFAYSVESADAIWHGHDDAGFAQLARIVAYLCLRSGIPPHWTKDVNLAGVARHVDLGTVGNPDGHTDPTTSVALWRRFMAAVVAESERGGFRRSWGVGRWL